MLDKTHPVNITINGCGCSHKKNKKIFALLEKILEKQNTLEGKIMSIADEAIALNASIARVQNEVVEIKAFIAGLKDKIAELEETINEIPGAHEALVSAKTQVDAIGDSLDEFTPAAPPVTPV